MRRLGVVGGLGPESTIDYYKALVEVWGRERADGSYPPLIIDSLDIQKGIALVSAGDMDGLTEYLVDSVQRLARGGAEVALISANTPHLVFDGVRAASPIPMISIVEAASHAAAARGMKRVALFGTRFTMQSSIYPDGLRRDGIEMIVPSEDEQAFIHEKYLGELVPGIFRDETREKLIAIIHAIHARTPIDAVILGGTELPLILREPEYGGVAMLDTTRIHVEAAVRAMLI
ncbi:MAG TPA: amino acid racemase [Thermoanaerobaculia bacterium]|jgi:aspartate racemase